ncbi:MAG: hypothetical protein AB1490_28720 [Pseudomonadota bacterium]
MAGAYLLSPMQSARAQGSTCDEASDIAVLPSPIAPWKGAPLRVLVASERAADGELSLTGPDGQVAARSRDRKGGPPYFWTAEVKTPAAGTWRVTLSRSGCGPVTRDITVRAEKPAGPGSVAGSIWPVRAAWTRETENLFSAWIDKLFDAPLDVELSWPALHVGLRDPSRNFLFNHLGLNEDQMNMVLRPDCADLPYFLRAYFAFKIGLPYGMSKCSRGGGGRGPTCPAWTSIQSSGGDANASAADTTGAAPDAPPKPRLGLAGAFGAYMKVVGDTVHSGSARTALADNNTDYYPVALSQQTLRPGTVYADPYGHILMIVKRVPQTAHSAGVILAVDGQPDGTVARKRFWRGNFLFAQNPALGGPGFKRFRPVVRGTDGVMRRLSNEQIARNPHYADFSLDQAKLGVEEFYDRMDDVMSPQPLDPLTAMKDAIDSLEEQVKTRVTSVENGRKFQNSGKGEANMPDGPAIFETIGAWEDYSTPSRDLRLLIAIDVVRGFPDRVARRPERYAMPMGKNAASVQAELQSVLAQELATRKFSYPRSDGSQWSLALKDVMERSTSLEMAYNPNDCVELRWGAASGSQEGSTCRKAAPQAQRAKMQKYRAWFTERRRPPRA